jgi:CubicO group peptidase (beta-lactamase class C family)
MKKKLLVVLAVLLLALAGGAYLFRAEIQRVRAMATLFSGAEQYQNFNRMTEFIPHTTMTAAAAPYQFPQRQRIDLPETFEYKGRLVGVEEFLKETDTAALLVLHDGALVYERYLLTGGRDVNWISMSVAKSFISAAIGVAVDEGRIDIERAVTDYLPELQGSAYDSVRVKDVLQMSSGAAWNEDYSDSGSDINRMGRLLALGGSSLDFAASLRRDFEPGTYNRYNSMDTQVLGLLLAGATGQSVTDYLESRLWHPLGMESDAYWLTDELGVELAFFGLNATARDYAKLGELFRNNGRWGQQQLVSADWVRASTTPDAPHLMPNVHADFPLGYGYQWWVPESEEGEYSAIGVYNQFIYVNPSRDLVIVKLSAFSDYATSLEQDAYRELETIEFFRELGRQLEEASP